MKRHAPKILAIVLLTAISVLTVIAGTGGFGESVNDGANADVPQVPSVEQTGAGGTGTVSDGVTSDNGSIEPEVPSFLPIAPEESDIYAYVQSLPFESGFELNAAHTTSEGTYIVITHASSGGGLKTPTRTVAIIKAERNGVLSSFMNLTHGADTSYLDSRLTAEGLIVVSATRSTTYIDRTSTDLGSRDILELPYADSAKIFTLNKGYLLFTSGATNSVAKIENNVIKAKAVLQSGEIKEVYDFGGYFTIFVNGINGYSVIKLDSKLKTLGEISLPERRLLAVQPVTRGGKQKYLVAESKDGAVELAEYFNDFAYATAERVGVGNATSADVFIKENRVFLLLHASTDRLYLIGEQLDYIASSSTVMQGITELLDCSAYNGGFNVLYIKSDVLVMLDLRDDGTEESRNFNVKADKAFVCGLKGDGLSVVYAEGNALKIIGLD